MSKCNHEWRESRTSQEDTSIESYFCVKCLASADVYVTSIREFDITESVAMLRPSAADIEELKKVHRR